MVRLKRGVEKMGAKSYIYTRMWGIGMVVYFIISTPPTKPMIYIYRV